MPADLSPEYLFRGLQTLHRVCPVIPSKGMAVRRVNDYLGVKIDAKTSHAGLTYLVKGPGWRFRLIICSRTNNMEADRVSGTAERIEESFMLARVSA